MQDAKDYLKRAVLILIASLAWNYALPGIIAYFDGTFYAGGIEAKLPAHNRDAISAYRNYEAERVRLRQLLRQTDEEITSLLAKGEGSAGVDGLVKIREVYKSELASQKSPIHLLPYYGNLTNYYFSMSCAFLGLLVFSGMRRDQFHLAPKCFVIRGFYLYIGWASIGWLRNFLFYREGRTIFSFANFDISPAGFFLQELRALVMFLLVAVVWELFLAKADAAASDIPDDGPHSLAALDSGAATVSRLFLEWQIASLLLLGSFLPWTFFYYSNVIRSGDSRYILSALVMHIYWLISWVLATLPLAISYRRWSELRSRALALRSEQIDESRTTDRALSFLRELNPLSSAQILWASVASAVSFFLPLLDVLKKV